MSVVDEFSTRFETVWSSAISKLADVGAEHVEHELQNSLGAVCKLFDLSAAGVLHTAPTRTTLGVRLEWSAPGTDSLRNLCEGWPEPARTWARDQVFHCSPLLIDSVAGGPAQPLLRSLEKSGMGAAVLSRLEVAGEATGALLFLTQKPRFPVGLVSRLRRMADGVGLALAWRDAVLAGRQLQGSFIKLLEASPEAICLTDETWNILHWSPACGEITRKSTAESAGRRLQELLFSEPDRARFEAWMASTLGASNSDAAFEFWSNGQALQVRSAILTLHGAAVYAFFLRRDTREQPRILRDSEVRELERRNLINALEKCNWRIQGESGAAALLGMRPSTLRDRMRSFGIERPQ